MQSQGHYFSRHFLARADAVAQTSARLLVFAILAVGLMQTAAAQTAARPERGIGPTGSYSVSDTGNVSLTNGNMSLSIPLAGLPPVAGGKLSWALRADYNSKLWDSVRAERQSDPIDPSTRYVVSDLQLSGVSGWRVGATYQISFEDDDWDYDWMAPAPNDPEYNLLTQNRWTKVVLTTPDGAEHELRPVDYGSYTDGFNKHNYLRGYYKENPNSVGAAMRYYSFDGSYLWAKIDPAQYLFAGPAPSWTLYLPDGTRVEQSNGVQRITDINGNKVKIWTDVTGAGVATTHYQDELTGREIKYVYDPAGNGGQGQAQAQYQTVGGGWVSVDVNFGLTHVFGKRYEFGDPECADAADYVDAWVTVVRSIVLPQTEPGQPRRQFTFSYNSDAIDATNFQWRPNCGAYQTVTQASHGWGSLSRMVTPAGATADYAYSLDGTHYLTSNPDDAPREALVSKAVTHDGVMDTWTYSVSPIGGGVAGPDGSTVNETKYTSDPAYKHSFAGYGGKEGLVYRTNQSDKVIVERHWRLLNFTGGDNISAGSNVLVTFNPVVDAEYTTLKEGGQAVRMSAKTYAHDYNGNVTEVKEYDWFDPALVSRDPEGVPTGVPAGVALLRTTTTSYHNSPGANASSSFVYAKRGFGTTTPSIYGAVINSTVGAGETRFSYDGQAYGAAPTVGNVTQVSRRDDKGDTDPNNDIWPTTSTVYGTYGNPSTTTDANGNIAQFFYDDLTHALPTRMVVDPLNGTGAQTTQTSYDFSTGLVTSTTDPNNKVSEVSYVNQLTWAIDPFGRPGVVTGPAVEVGGVTQRRKVFNFYEDAARRMRVESDLNAEGDQLRKSRTTSDQLGRVVLAEQSENGSTYSISSVTVYAEAGRVTLQSYPTRGDGSSPDGWTRVTKDNAGRVVEAATFGGAAQPSATLPANTITNWMGSVLTAFWANETTVTDQAGKSRKNTVDALGRLVRVVEAPGVQNYGFVTDYAYDALGNLRKVDQGGQLRFFMYDSLSRLIRVKNPEQGAFAADVNFPALTDSSSGTSNGQWSTGNRYDPAGNLTKRKDARGVVATYGYDGLNRNTTITYSGEAGTPTPNVTRSYDGATLGKGRLWKSEAAQTSKTTVDKYDAAGRPLEQTQKFWVNGQWGQESYTTKQGYDLTGGVISQTYPSGHSVSYGYDAAGRLNSFTGNLGDGGQRTYSAGIAYDAAGRVRQEQFGTQTPVYNKRLYNGRGQLAEMRVSTHSLFEQGYQTDWNRGAIINHYSTSGWGASGGGPDNNGNLLNQDVFIPNDDAISGYSLTTSSYGYDALNRLSWAKEVRGGADQWRQQYDYDRWGNRTINAANTWGAPEPQFAVDANTNRLGVPSGQAGSMAYDLAGNLSNDSYTGGGTRAYDAEGRMTSAQFLSGQTQTAAYTYDADGRRVKRKAGVGAEVWQVHGMGGELLAEYATNASHTQPVKEYGYRGGELLVTAEAPTRVNVALASNGATATAQNYTQDGVFAGLHFQPAYANDGVRYINPPDGDRFWRDEHGLASWLQVEFAGQKTIDEVSVYTVDDYPDFLTQADPSATQTFTQYGATSFEVQYWTGSAWATVQGGSVSGNNFVWRKLTFPAVTTSKIRVVVTGASDGVARVAELEAWGTTAQRANVALSSAGATVAAQNYTQDGVIAGYHFYPSSAIDGWRFGHLIPAGYDIDGFWRDEHGLPTWLEVSFNGPKSIDEVNVFTIADYPAFLTQADPPATQTFTQYGATSFEVQYWTGSAWANVTGGSVTGSNLVWRKFTFPALTTSKIRVRVNAAADGVARVAEVEAWGTNVTGTTADVRWLVSDQLGTPRMVVDQTGSLAKVSRHDYMPFGEELYAGTGGRTSTQGYNSVDSVRQKFTGYERDIETNLDFAQARYYASPQGRFIAIDPYNIVMERQYMTDTQKAESQFIAYLSNPQRWARYTYALNNPLLYTDPNGEDVTIYYRPRDEGAGSIADQGHILIYVRNDETGESAYYDYVATGDYKNKGDTQLGEVTQDRINEHASITIETNASQEQAILKGIKEAQAGSPDYSLSVAGSGSFLTHSEKTCTSNSIQLLRLGGINVGPALGPQTPAAVWTKAFMQFGNRESNDIEKTIKLAPPMGPTKVISTNPAVGREYGRDPRGQARVLDRNATNNFTMTFKEGKRVN